MSLITKSGYGDVFILSRERTCLFTQPESVISCMNPEDVLDSLAEVDAAITRGFYVTGFLSYEAGWIFMDRQPKRILSGLPLLWFGLYKAPQVVQKPTVTLDSVPVMDWKPGISREVYLESVQRIRAYIQAGDTYQVNFTFPFYAPFEAGGRDLFTALYHAQPTDHAGYLDLGRFRIASLSPELFFRVEGERLVTRPMKGTLPRGCSPESDILMRNQLQESPKDRAENLMIVDLLRNDMGRISDIGSVAVEHLFDVERYATVWQMTSTIASKTGASFSEVMKALFPCGSVTGAPKLRTMEIIDEVEQYARGAYCGTIGWWGPDRRASFNVAIRTVTLDSESGLACYPVGGGITWGSTPDGEYAECLAKAAALLSPRPGFELLESLLFEGEYYLLEGHLERLGASAAYFDFPLCADGVREALTHLGKGLGTGRWKVRLLLDRQGRHRVEALPAPATHPVRIALAASPVSRHNTFLYHKTTCRDHYETALASRPGFDDVLLWNEEGELTETTTANIVALYNGTLVTPPVSCGLLPGVMRAEMLRRGEIREAVLPITALSEIGEIYLINSVRKKIPATVCGEGVQEGR